MQFRRECAHKWKCAVPVLKKEDVPKNRLFALNVSIFYPWFRQFPDPFSFSQIVQHILHSILVDDAENCKYVGVLKEHTISRDLMHDRGEKGVISWDKESDGQQIG